MQTKNETADDTGNKHTALNDILKIKADHTTWTIAVDLEPNKKYQVLILDNFRSKKSMPLQLFLIEFQTGEEMV